MDFLSFAETCGPDVHPVTTVAMIKAESRYQPLAVRNNTSKQTFYPATIDEARVLVEGFAAKGDRLAIGLMQVTTPWVTRYNIKPADLLDGCTNVRIGTSILRANYEACTRVGRSPKATLECALSMYWSGDDAVGGAYVNQVYQLAGSANRVQETQGVSDGVLRSKAGKTGVVPSFQSVPVSKESAGFSPQVSDGFTFR